MNVMRRNNARIPESISTSILFVRILLNEKVMVGFVVFSPVEADRDFVFPIDVEHALRDWRLRRTNLSAQMETCKKESKSKSLDNITEFVDLTHSRKKWS